MVPSALRDRLAALAPRHGIRLALVFGSAVSELVHDRSDFDLALLLERPDLGLSALGELSHELQASVPGRELDLAFLNRADPLFLHQVLSACEVAYGSPEVFQNLRLYAFRRYQDHLRFLDLERTYVRRVIERFDAA
jgi:predicted nucleotidyltransferase